MNEKRIQYDADTHDFCLTLDGEFIGYAATYADGERILDEIVYERLRRQPATVATGYRYQEMTVKDVFPNQHADLDCEDGYDSEWEILADMFGMDNPEAYKLYTAVEMQDDGTLDTSGNSRIIILHLPDAGRVGIINNAYTTWADDRGDNIDTLINLYLNDPDEWVARN